MQTIFTIGHGSRTKEQFNAILNHHEIKLLIDVRSRPYSKHNPQFNTNQMQVWLKCSYVHMPNLGGYYHGPQAVREAALSRVMEFATSKSVCLMCSELDFNQCHRKELAENLAARGCEVKHIIDQGATSTQKPKPQFSLAMFL